MIILCALLGLVVGNFLNWTSDYLPRLSSSCTVSLSDPPTRPIPVLWRLLTSSSYRRGLALFQKPPWLEIAVELLAALLLGYLWLRFGFSRELVLLAFAGSFFLLIAAIDLKYRLVPNVLVFPAGVVALLLAFVPPGHRTLLALLGGAVGTLPFLLVVFLKPGSIGGGDVKLATLIGLVVGFPQVLWALSIGILAGGIAAIVLFLTRRWGPKSHIPYAPFLCLGTMISLLWPFPLAFPQ